MGDASGEISLFIPNDGNIGWITSIAEKATSQDTIEVALLNIGPFLNERKPNFIKIDVEGAEAPILERIQDLISASYRPIILVRLLGGAQPQPLGTGRYRRLLDWQLMSTNSLLWITPQKRSAGYGILMR